MITIDLTIYGVIVFIILLVVGFLFMNPPTFRRKQDVNNLISQKAKLEIESAMRAFELKSAIHPNPQQDKINNTKHEMD